ncbi:hypothetical protein ACFLTR_01185 [Chloroflexota bacterium]
MQSEKTKEFSPDDVITALLFFLPDEFSNDPEKIHRTIRKLQQEEEYKDLLKGFEFLDYLRFPYSSLLGRILNRLQESRLLSSRNPGYMVYETKKSSRDAIESYFLSEGKVLYEQRGKLEKIALELRKKLKNDE